MNEQLVQHVRDNDWIETIYFNSIGEWLFSNHPAYPESKTRAEVLGEAPVKSKKSKNEE